MWPARHPSEGGALGLLFSPGCRENAARSVRGTNPFKTLLPAPGDLYPEVRGRLTR